jgi:hypothetical protein
MALPAVAGAPRALPAAKDHPQDEDIADPLVA